MDDVGMLMTWPLISHRIRFWFTNTMSPSLRVTPMLVEFKTAPVTGFRTNMVPALFDIQRFPS